MEKAGELILETIIIYIVVVTSLRIMGKRQIAELQPSELVITLIVSEIATAPIQDNKKTLIETLIPIVTLVIFEIIISYFDLKSPKFRNLVQGSSIIIVENGVVKTKELRKLRYSMEDLWEELRKKDIYDLEDIQYAIAETDGKISIIPLPEKRPITPSDIGLAVDKDENPESICENGIKGMSGKRNKK